ncbi:MAG TPA: tripartite tricarboxylate transporter substrate binding protein [Xanthobacteraceae bacterium]|jgi:tripartite-type tricarboxylate transporter receptor subunit TctC
MKRLRLLFLCCIAVLSLAVVRDRDCVLAQSGSSRPVRIIVPFDPGAAVDIVARILARGLSAQWDRPVIVENRPGASMIVGAQFVANSEPDGDTLLLCLDDLFTTLPHLSKNPAFDANKELVPVDQVAKILMILVANRAVPANTLPQLIELARAKPGMLSYGSSGPGSATNLGMEMLKHLAHVDILHVPFRGLAPALTATASGTVQMTMIGYGTAHGMLEDGRQLKPIVVTSPQRVAELPDLPTIGELGYPQVDSTSSLTLVAPAKISAETIGRLTEALSRELSASSETRKQIEARDIVVTNITGRPLAEEIARRFRLNGEAVRVAGVQVD